MSKARSGASSDKEASDKGFSFEFIILNVCLIEILDKIEDQGVDDSLDVAMTWIRPKQLLEYSLRNVRLDSVARLFVRVWIW